MHWNVRNQLLIPVAAATFCSLLGLGVWLSLRSAQIRERAIEARISQVLETIRDGRFPLNSSVCRQLKKLSGVDLLVISPGGAKLAYSEESLPDVPPTVNSATQIATSIRQRPKFRVGDKVYYWVSTEIRHHANAEAAAVHLFYDADEIDRERWLGFWPIVIACLLAGIVTTVSITLVTQRIVGRLKKLAEQCQKVAAGDFTVMPVPAVHDEIRILTDQFNEMSTHLATARKQIEEAERFRTLNLLASGMAHQLRNYTTGALLAIDLIPPATGDAAESRSVAVAKRQLQLMETYINNLLALSKPSRSAPRQVDLVSIVSEVLLLIEPHVSHANATLTSTIPGQAIEVRGDPERLRELLINLLLNAIEAISQIKSGSRQRVVSVALAQHSRVAQLRICDNGPGPPAELLDSIFEPFVTARPEGIGLGLSICRLIVREHLGKISLDRDGNETCVTVQLPLAAVDRPSEVTGND